MTMIRRFELRPKARTQCDLNGCFEALRPDGIYHTLRDDTQRMFAGTRAFCSEDHRDEYEMRVVLAGTKKSGTSDPRVPGYTTESVERSWSDEN